MRRGALGGDPPVGSPLVALAHRVALRPGAKRYDRLKAWSFPTPTRKTVRLLAGFIPVSVPPEDFHQVADTATLLIAAARETGKLGELGAELGKLDRQGVENARVLLILVEAARGRGASVAPLAQAAAADLPRKWPAKSPLTGPALSPGVGVPPDWSDVLVARACLAEPTLRPVGEAMVRDLITHAARARVKGLESLLAGAFAAAKGDRP